MIVLRKVSFTIKLSAQGIERHTFNSSKILARTSLSSCWTAAPDYASLGVGVGFLVAGGPDYKKNGEVSLELRKIGIRKKTKAESLTRGFLFLAASTGWVEEGLEACEV